MADQETATVEVAPETAAAPEVVELEKADITRLLQIDWQVDSAEKTLTLARARISECRAKLDAAMAMANDAQGILQRAVTERGQYRKELAERLGVTLEDYLLDQEGRLVHCKSQGTPPPREPSA